MNGALTISTKNTAEHAGPVFCMDHLMVELHRTRRHAEQLSIVNELHRRLAVATDLQGMMEAFSVWLAPFLEHDLIGYDNPGRNRRYLFCSSHGPQKQKVMAVAEEALSRNADGFLSFRSEPFTVSIWSMGGRHSEEKLILLRKGGAVNEDGMCLVGEGLRSLRDPLLRALAYEDLFQLACHDPLTGLTNRRVFEDRIGSLLQQAARYDHPICIACMDLDRFKQVNDCFGHAEGDRVLRLVADELSRTVRGSDLLVRMGGDEFILVLPDTCLADSQNLAERIRLAIESLGVSTPSGEKLGISIGVVQWQAGMTKEEWLRVADEVLYEAKAQGRSRVCVAC